MEAWDAVSKRIKSKVSEGIGWKTSQVDAKLFMLFPRGLLLKVKASLGASDDTGQHVY